LSKIEVNTVDVQCGSTLTLGSSGKTVTLATGASQSGFGRTGTVDWCTTAKTSPFTAVNGDGFFVNTSGGVVTVTLPSSPTAGSIIALKDYANTWDTNNVTVCRNGSKINGECANATLNTESQSVTLIYVDGTKGWQDIQDSTSDITGNPGYTVASGGTETNSPCGNFKIHTFTASGPLNITNIGTPAGGTNKVSYMVVAGGGGAGTYYGGGGGGGGFREGKVSGDPFTASPLVAPDGLAVSVADFTITVGAGGAVGTPSPRAGTVGGVSTFSSITSAGGGFGNGGPTPAEPGGGSGGSGGGGSNPCSGGDTGGRPGGAGNTPPVSPPQGNPGVTVTGPQFGGAGGGATAAGSIRAGGAGATNTITASPVGRAGGGGGGPGPGAGPVPGAASASDGGGTYCTSGTTNTGGGGGSDGGSGGSGIVVIRYKFQ
jgi:hypothetical protein